MKKINWNPQYEPWGAPSPSDDEVRAFYEQLQEIRDAHLCPEEKKAWLFGIVHPETREFGLVTYVCKEHPSIHLVRGTRGVESVLAFESVPDSARSLFETPVLSVEWDDPEGILDASYQRLRKLGLEFSEEEKVPNIYAVRPGFMPHFPTAQELRFLSLALRKLVELSPELDDLSPESGLPFQCPTLLPPRRKSGEWQLVPDMTLKLPSRKHIISPELLQKVRALPKGPESRTVYLEWLRAPVEVVDDAPPSFMYLLLTVESVFGRGVQINLLIPKLSLDDVYERVPGAVLRHLQNIGQRPFVLHTVQEDIFEALRPLEKLLGVRVNLGESPPVLDMALHKAHALLQEQMEAAAKEEED